MKPRADVLGNLVKRRASGGFLFPETNACRRGIRIEAQGRLPSGNW